MARKPASRALRHDLKSDRRTGLKRLLRLADGLETVPEAVFNFGKVVRVGEKPPLEALAAGGGCGTVACAIGWGPAFLPKVLQWDDDKEATTVLRRGTWRLTNYDDVAQEVFALTQWEANRLFKPNGIRSTSSPLGVYATPKEVARDIRRWATAELRKVS